MSELIPCTMEGRTAAMNLLETTGTLWLTQWETAEANAADGRR